MQTRGARLMIALFSLAGCRASETHPLTGPLGPVPSKPPSLAAGMPAPWRPADIAEAIRTFQTRTASTHVPPPSPADGTKPPFFVLPDGTEELSTDAFYPRLTKRPIAQGERGARVAVHDLWLDAPPVVEVNAAGELMVRFKTRRAMAGGRLSVGAYVQGPVLRQPVLRTSVALGTEDGVQFVGRYDLRRLLREKYDIQDMRLTGRGQFIFRIEVLDQKNGAPVIDDGRVHLRCHPAPCGQKAKFVQLPTIALGPFVDLVHETSATISFETSAPTAAEIWLRDKTGWITQIPSHDVSTRHEIPVTGLSTGTAYRYLVLCRDHRGEVSVESQGTLQTASATARLSVAVMSDSRAAPGTATAAYHGVNRDAVTRLVTQAFMRGANLIVFAGDLINGYTTAPGAYTRQLDAWRESVERVAMHIPIYEAMGNHEFLADAWSAGWMADRATGDNSETLFARAFVNPTNGPQAAPGAPPYEENVFSFDRGPVHFTVLNTNYAVRTRHWRTDHPAYPRGHYEGEVSDAQLAWLDRDLAEARARGRQHLLVFAHEPGFPNGGHVEDAMYYGGKFPHVLERRRRFWQILSKHGVLAAFFGDEHNYSRTRIDADLDATYTRPVWQIITGGAGAPFYAQDRTVPWTDQVASFENGHHFVMLDVEGATVTLQARDIDGQLRDRVVLTDEHNSAPAGGEP